MQPLLRKVDGCAAVHFGGGWIFMLGWPGLRAGIDGRGWIDPDDRQTALQGLASAGCRNLYALTEREELPPGTRGGLRAAAAGCGISVRVAPIRDFQPPDSRFMRRWESHLRNDAHDLQQGRQVAFCCMAGAGRSGTLAALLLVMAGVPSADAIALIRAANPEAIESRAQEQWLTSYFARHPLGP